ncbi:MAG: bifunctional methylenetetrahydrofolate dehydrogenase/methenyltetrahydrofolate cyclohydrolase FolD [Clostridiaceae bacterium]|nr:bifunctional methylenetetrahydrofolate dehydrogenase/methenyltetrahydrofolate cyclohydrolase FolD [Clostridiaceae bacterium]
MSTDRKLNPVNLPAGIEAEYTPGGALILDGKLCAKLLREEVRLEAQHLTDVVGRSPGLAVIQVGEDPASSIYVNNKKRACEAANIRSFSYHLSEDATLKDVLDLIESINNTPEVDGILVQLPLPKHISEQLVINAIDPGKDVDCFHPLNVAALFGRNQKFLPCTPAGVMEILRRYRIDVAGKKALVIGRSNIVGKPMALLLLAANATVTVAHSKTVDLSSACRNADIVVVAAGQPGLVGADDFNERAVVIDVGINRVGRKVVGDVDFKSVADKVAAITPVPGGVGPMTIAMLLRNTLTAFKEHNDL